MEAVANRDSTGVFALLREALAGSHKDFTQGNIRRAIVILAIPMILEMMMESLFGVVDMFFVARLGVDSLATVALTESMLVLIFGVAIGISMSATAFVARRIGEKDTEGAAVGAVQAIAVGLLISVLVAVAGLFFAKPLLSLMGASPSVIQTGTRYTRLMLGSSAVIFLLFLINAIFRGAGDPALSMRVLWIANGINIVLDPCLINGWGPFPKLNVFGAAVATTTGRGIGVAVQLFLLMGGYSRVRIHRRQIRIVWDVMWRLLRVSFTGILQFLIATASWTGLVRLCAVFGTVPVAGYNIAIRIFLFLLLPAWGMSNAAATLVGQNLGAKRPDRAEASVYATGQFTMAYMALTAIVLVGFARPLAMFFTQDPAVVAVAADCMRFIGAGGVVYAWGMVLVQAFNGSGDTRTPSIVNFFSYWCFQIPVAYTLARTFEWGPRGVFFAVPAAETLMTVASIILFRRGAWKRKVI
jgi:putative MATE family efflux protein